MPGAALANRGYPRVTGNMRVRVLLNAEGGTVRREGTGPEGERITAVLANLGVEVAIVASRGADLRHHAEQALDDARTGSLDAVVVAGGDGSVRTVAGALAGTETPLGVLPLGTLNHFAKDLGIPTDLEGAAAVIAAGHTRCVDLAEVNGHVFVNNSSIGVYPYMVLDRERRRAEFGRSKRVAMSLAFLRALRRLPVRRLTVGAEGWATPCRTPCIFIGNNEYRMDLFSLGSRVRLDGGKLWLYIVRPCSAAGLVGLAFRGAVGRLDQARDFDMLSAEEAEIRSRASRLPVALDGEIETLRPPLKYRILPGALRVLAPGPESGG